ncbi:hypothetical protein GO988_17330 [Hymenobacter sp. HMF4947]|uniref:Uncharacterized protein n=1 Tax=Hymenobacter ginkgonis TaxID=2682976 RepID=A0A7K1TI57_9BACT|nr:hypothetical protein [Hymenobacter ginkgonis]MVN78095.1 hypothetical protein [Hymenobacter ginkgonis]
MQNTILPAGIIHQKHFDRYAAQWLSALTSPHHKILRRSFQPTNDKKSRTLLVTFPLEHIIFLVSTVGASYIEARFLLMNSEEENASSKRARFTVALFATNAQGTRVSAYYVSNEDVETHKPLATEVPKVQGEATLLLENQLLSTGEMASVADSPDAAEQVPHHMVSKWLYNWRHADAITPALFTTNYGPLEGYRFSLADFREPLFNALPLVHDKKRYYNLRVNFGLHEYYSAVQDSTEPTQTFGLVLRLHELPIVATQATTVTTTSTRSSTSRELESLTAEEADDEVSESFFDMSTPCPPGH